MIGPGVGKIDICPRLPHHPAQSLSNPISSSGPAPLSAARAEPRNPRLPFRLTLPSNSTHSCLPVHADCTIATLSPTWLNRCFASRPFFVQLLFYHHQHVRVFVPIHRYFFLHLQILFLCLPISCSISAPFNGVKQTKWRSDI